METKPKVNDIIRIIKLMKLGLDEVMIENIYDSERTC